MTTIPPLSLSNFVHPVADSDLQTKIDAILTHLANYPPVPPGFAVYREEVDTAWKIVFERLKSTGCSILESPEFYFVMKYSSYVLVVFYGQNVNCVGIFSRRETIVTPITQSTLEPVNFQL